MATRAFGDMQQNARRVAARPHQGPVRAVVLAAPASTAHKVKVQAEGDTSGLYLGEASWPKPAGKELPAKGDICLVAFDNRNVPWVIGWDLSNWGH